MRAAFIAEGKTERALIGVLEQLCRGSVGEEIEIEIEWAHEFLARFDNPGKKLGRQIQTLLTHDPDFDLLFVHRDADSMDGFDARRIEISEAKAACPGSPCCVRVVPVQETEAWLLTDAQPLRDVVGNPRGTVALGLPKLAQIEACGDPKEVLRGALARARLRSRKDKPDSLTSKEFGEFRARLLEQLDIDGPVTQLPAWGALVTDTKAALTEYMLRKR